MFNLLVVLLAVFLAEISFMGGRPIISLRLAELGLSSIAVGLILTIGSLIPLIASVPMGSLSDRMGTVRVLVIASILTVIGFIGLSWFSGLVPVTISFAVSMIGASATIIALQVMVDDVGRPEQRAQNFGWFGTAVALAQIVGPAVSGFVAGHYSIITALLVMAVAGALPLPMVPLLGRIVASTRLVRTTAPPRLSLQTARGILAIPDMRYAMTLGFLLMFAFDIRTTFLPIFMQEVGITPVEIGLLFALQGLAAFSVRMLMGFLIKFVETWKLVAISIAAAVPAFVAIHFITSAGWMMIPSFILGMSLGLTQPLTMTIVAGTVAANSRGLAMGMRMSLQRLGNAASPITLGLVAAWLGIGATFLVTGGITALCFAVALARALKDSSRA